MCKCTSAINILFAAVADVEHNFFFYFVASFVCSFFPVFFFFDLRGPFMCVCTLFFSVVGHMCVALEFVMLCGCLCVRTHALPWFKCYFLLIIHKQIYGKVH